ncbi:hypothetical protein D805_0706 [Bifidobacterium thermophilum RBL67]|uniref:Uncharacterized protein n=1 Tax=Bifidobacterium thermophilum RBL67 TaxID=1254439 RepID=M4REK0_9BIFI|nr:hypothetical protein D805_0706 [Bifidobacterium thermophilum RBL67]
MCVFNDWYRVSRYYRRGIEGVDKGEGLWTMRGFHTSRIDG